MRGQKLGQGYNFLFAYWDFVIAFIVGLMLYSFFCKLIVLVIRKVVVNRVALRQHKSNVVCCCGK